MYNLFWGQFKDVGLFFGGGGVEGILLGNIMYVTFPL